MAKTELQVMNKIKPWTHIAAWTGLYICWILIFQNHALAITTTMTVEFCYLFFIAGNYYFNVQFTIPKLLYQKKYITFGLMLLAGIVAGAILRVPLAMYLNKHFFLVDKPQPLPSKIFLNSLVNIFVWVICIVAAKVIIDKIRFQNYVAGIEKEKIKNELDFLKAQFNPHFLFNSINSIYGHIDKKNTDARNMLLTFSEMLRYQLYECNVESINIEKEINYIKNYVALQQVRKEESLIVKLNINDNVKGFTIAPLLFIAFIENAFKYVSNNDAKENRVEISLCGNGNNIHFQIFNTKEINNTAPIKHKGIGIANVKRRLELLYPGKYKLNIGDAADTYEVTLNLQLHET
jgi:two-component system LytT family sensor kinase